MPFDTTDAVTEEAVRSTVEDYVEEQLQFRRAFRQVQAPEDADPWHFVNPDDTLGEPDEIQPGAEYPAMEEDYSKIEVARRKFAGKVGIIDEAEMENTFDVMAAQIDILGRKMAEKLNGEAFSHLNSNLNTDSPVGDNGGTMDYDDVLTGKRHLREDGFEPDLLIIDPLAEEDILSDQDFTTDTAAGTETVREGTLNRASGLDVVVANTGDLTDHDGFVVDTDNYGYEARWSGVDTKDWRDESSDTTYIGAKTYANWVDINSGGAIKVQG